jgi:transmembrane 9 superfamily protein 2/4
MTAMVTLFIAAGYVNGYVSGSLYRTFKGTNWVLNAFVSATLYPGVIFVVFCVLNTLIWHAKSSGAVPFGTFFLLIFLWFGVSVPLVYAGAYHALKTEKIEHPMRTNKIPRQVPAQAWYMSDFVQVLVGGVLPFGAIFIELFFIMTSLWLHQFYYIFGFLGLVFLILCITCAEISVMLCYFQLVAENHRWWWRAFGTSASSALYLFGYGCHYFSTKLEVTNKISAAMFFGYLFISSALFFAMTGAVGFAACFWFVRTIYASVKLD